jgi:hypothetical protein
VPGYYLPPNRHPTKPGDYEALSRYAGHLRAAAKRFQAISDDGDAWVCFYAEGWHGEWKDQLFAVWCQQITANDAMNASAWAQDRADFVRANPRLARLYDLNSDHGQTCFRVAIDSCNAMAAWLDGCSQTIRQEEAQAEAFFLDALIIIVSVGVSIASLGSLSAPAMILAGALIGGVTAGAIDATNQGVYNQYGLQHGFDWEELGLSTLTGFVVGGLSTLAGLGLGFVIVRGFGLVATEALPALGVSSRSLIGFSRFLGGALDNTAGLAQTGTRIAIHSAGFGFGTFASEVGMQAFDHWVDPTSRAFPGVDLGQAAQDGLLSSAFGAAFEAGHAGLNPDTFHWSIDTPGGSYHMVAQPDGTNSVFEARQTLLGVKESFIGTGEIKPVAIVQPDGTHTQGLALEITAPDGIVDPPKALINSQFTAGTSTRNVTVSFDEQGRMSFVRLVGTSDGSVTLMTGDGPVTVEKGLRFQLEPVNNAARTWEPAWPKSFTDYKLVNGGFSADASGFGPQIAGGGHPPTPESTPPLTSSDVTGVGGTPADVGSESGPSGRPVVSGDLAPAPPSTRDTPRIVQTAYTPEAAQGDHPTMTGPDPNAPVPAEGVEVGDPKVAGLTPPALDQGPVIAGEHVSLAAAGVPGDQAVVLASGTGEVHQSLQVTSGGGDDRASLASMASAGAGQPPPPAQPVPLARVDPVIDSLARGEAGAKLIAVGPAEVAPELGPIRPEAPVQPHALVAANQPQPAHGDVPGPATPVHSDWMPAHWGSADRPDLPIHRSADGAVDVVGVLPGGHLHAVYALLDGETGQFLKWGVASDPLTRYRHGPGYRLPQPGETGWSDRLPPELAGRPVVLRIVANLSRADAIALERLLRERWGGPANVESDYHDNSPVERTDLQRELTGLDFGRWLGSRGGLGLDPGLVSELRPGEPALPGSPHGRPPYPPSARPLFDPRGRPLVDASQVPVGPAPRRGAVTRPLPPLDPAIQTAPPNRFWERTQLPVHRDATGAVRVVGELPGPGRYVVYALFDRATGEFLKWGKTNKPMGRYRDPVVMRIVLTDLSKGRATQVEELLNERWGGPKNLERVYMDDQTPVRQRLQSELASHTFATWLAGHPELGIDPGLVQDFAPGQPALPGTLHGRLLYPRSSEPIFESAPAPDPHADPFPALPARAPAEPITVVGVDPAAVLRPESPEFEQLWKALWHLNIDSGLEHAVVQTADGQFKVVYGGKYEILDNPDLEIRAVYLHVHPYWLPPEGPSPQDIRFLAMTRGPQDHAYLLEPGAPPVEYAVPPELRQIVAAGDVPDAGLVATRQQSQQVSAQVAASESVLDASAQKTGVGYRVGGMALRVPSMPSGNNMPLSARALAMLFGSDPQLIQAWLMQQSSRPLFGKPTGYIPRFILRALASPRFGLMNSLWAFAYRRGQLWSKVTLPNGATYLVLNVTRPSTKFTYTGPNLGQRPNVKYDLPILPHPPDLLLPLGGGFAIAVGSAMNIAPYIQTGELRFWRNEGQGSFSRAIKLSGPGPKQLGPYHRDGHWVEAGPQSVSFMGGSWTGYAYGVTLMWGPFNLISVSIATGAWVESETATNAPTNSIAEGMAAPFKGRESVVAHPYLGVFVEPFQFIGDISRYSVAAFPELYAIRRAIPGIDRLLDAIGRTVGGWVRWDAFHPTFGATVELDNFRLWHRPPVAPPASPAPPRAKPGAGTAPPRPMPRRKPPPRTLPGARPKHHQLRTSALPQSGPDAQPGGLRTTPAGRPPLRRPASSVAGGAGDLKGGLMVLDALQVDVGPAGQLPPVGQAVRDLREGLDALNAAADALIEASGQGLAGSDLAARQEAAARALANLDEKLTQAQALAGREDYAREQVSRAATVAAGLPTSSRPPELAMALSRLENLPLSHVVTSTRDAVDATRAVLNLLAVAPVPASTSGLPPALEQTAIGAAERMLGAPSAARHIVGEAGRVHAVFDRATGTMRLPQSQVDAIARAFAGRPLNQAEIADLADAVVTFWHELNHAADGSPGPPVAPDSYTLEYGRNLEEGSVEWNARATVADFAEAAGILDAAGLTREQFLAEALATGRPYAAHVAMASGFAELGGAELLGFDSVADYRQAQAVQTPATRPAWMAGRVITAQGLPDTADIRAGMLGAIERGFSGELSVLSPAEVGREVGERALRELTAEVERAAAGRPGPGPVQVPSRFEPELYAPTRRVRAEVPRGIGHEDDPPQYVELRVPAVTQAGKRINAALATPTEHMTEAEFATASAHRLEAIQSSLPGADGQALARVEEQALRVAWRYEETLRVNDLLFAGPADAARKQAPPDVVRAVFRTATNIIDRFNDPSLTSAARQSAIRAEVADLRAQVAGTPLAEAIPFDAIEAAVSDLQGTVSAGVLDVDAAGNLLRDGQPAGTLRDLFQDVATGNQVNYNNGIDREYIVHVETPRFSPHAEVQVIARPKVFSVSPPGVPAEKLAPLGAEVTGRYLVEIGAGSGSFAVDMIPLSELESSVLVQTDVADFAVKAQTRRDLRFGLRWVAPRSGPNSVVVLGDALKNMEMLFGRPGPEGGVRRVIVNNINAHYRPGEYDALAQGLRAALAVGGQVEVQWDDSPEDASGASRGHIRGPQLRDALQRAGVPIEYRAEPGIPYPYDVTPPGGERPGRAVPNPPDPTSATGGRAVIRRLAAGEAGGGVTVSRPAIEGVWQPSSAEASLAARVPLVPGDRLPKLPGDHANDVYLVLYDAGARAVFKPEIGVTRIGRQQWRNGELWRQVGGELWAPIPLDDWRAPREVASARTDEMLRFGLVPPTTLVAIEPLGSGSLQDWVDGTGELAAEDYRVEDQQRTAVLHYILGHPDAGSDNLMTVLARPVSIDNGDTFPASAADARIASPFLDLWFDRPLLKEVLAELNAVRPEEYRLMLLATGLSEAAAGGAVARMEEIQNQGRITGEAWDGDIIGARGIIRGRR